LTECAVPSDTAKSELWRWFGAIRSLAEERKPYQLMLRLVVGPLKVTKRRRIWALIRLGILRAVGKNGLKFGATPTNVLFK
jgi:hypothetical protein